MNLSGVIISKKNSNNNFAIIFGGTPSDKFGAQFLKNKCEKYLSDKNVIYSNWENTPEAIEQYVLSKYPNAKFTSVCGFSKGGLRAWAAAGSGKYNFVGLIDPSIEGNYLSYKVSPNANVIMTFKPDRTWGLNSLNYAKKVLGNQRIIPVPAEHTNQVDVFFSRFSDYL